MPSTPNKVFSVPTRGSEVGTWDVPVNGNMTILDNLLGSVTSKSLTGVAAVTLSTSEQQVMLLRFTGTLSANCIVTATMPGFYIVENQCAGNFTVSLSTGGGETIAVPRGAPLDVVCDGTNWKFRNLGPCGIPHFWYVSTMPAWVLACTVAPYLYMDGSTFSSATYPALAAFLGGTTLPDFRSFAPIPLDNMGGTAAGRIGTVVTSTGTIVGTTLGTSGGAPTHALTVAQLASHNHGGSTGTDGNHNHSYDRAESTLNVASGGTGAADNVQTQRNTSSDGNHNHSISGAGSNEAHNNMQPSKMAGLLVIKT